jgi:hypothetical protein
VVAVKPSTPVRDVAKLFLQRQISAVPVVDEQGKLVGIVSEGDLMHRAEIGTERRRSWWLLLLAEDQALDADYIKAHARKVEDVMTRNRCHRHSGHASQQGCETAREAWDQTGPHRQRRPADRHRQQTWFKRSPAAAASSRSRCRIRRSGTSCWRISARNAGRIPGS